jgi:hypothetical protein
MKKSTAKKKAAPKKNAATKKKVAAKKKNNGARFIRHKVKVGGKEYRSVPAAFEALGLPMNKMVAFRKDLKAKKKLKFQKHTFVLVTS